MWTFWYWLWCWHDMVYRFRICSQELTLICLAWANLRGNRGSYIYVGRSKTILFIRQRCGILSLRFWTNKRILCGRWKAHARGRGNWSGLKWVFWNIFWKPKKTLSNPSNTSPFRLFTIWFPMLPKWRKKGGAKPKNRKICYGWSIISRKWVAI